MTSDGIPAPPEGRLIRSVRERAIPKISIRAAAARIRISPEHWGNIERGYKSVSADDAPQKVEASAGLLAKMAAAVGVTPEQLEAEGQRPDAARALRAEQATPRAVLRPAPPPGEEDEAAVYLPAIRQRLRDLAAAGDTRPSGDAMFDPAADPFGIGPETAGGLADGWDTVMARGIGTDQAAVLAARAWAVLAGYNARKRERSGGQSGALART